MIFRTSETPWKSNNRPKEKTKSQNLDAFFYRIEPNSSPIGKSAVSELQNYRNSIKDELMNSLEDSSSTEGTDDVTQNISNVAVTRNRRRKATDPTTVIIFGISRLSNIKVNLTKQEKFQTTIDSLFKFL